VRIEMENLGEKSARLWEIIGNLTTDQRSDVLSFIFGYMGQHEKFLNSIESALAINKAYWEHKSEQDERKLERNLEKGAQ
jgi:hypothetical protein